MSARVWTAVLLVCPLLGASWGSARQPAQPTPVQPPAGATGRVDFDRDIRPILEESCWKCHGQAKHRAGLRLDSSESVLTGGDSGPAAIAGKSAESLLIELVSGKDPDRIMPDEGPRLTPRQIELLAAWIDQGLAWGTRTPQSSPHKYELALKPVSVPPPAPGSAANPIDRIVGAYFSQRSIEPPPPVDDRAFARRVCLDTVGLLPDPRDLEAFVADTNPLKREALVREMLADNRGYAEHWLTFWNDALRNDYAGTGFIDGGREQITQWLFDALSSDMPYDRFVAELVNPPSQASAGFSKGIVWRGVVNASQIPPMQAAQNLSQVFLGLNLKCASCHDSFINDWKLADAYGLAAAFSDSPLEVSRCDQPMGKMASASFLYKDLGSIDAAAPKPERLRQLSALLVARENGRFTRTIVNRLWARLMGRGLIEPVDEMDNPPWNADLLDWLAADLIDHGYDVKKTIALIMTSRAYQLLATPGAEKFESDAPFSGPVVRRMTAEQFVDAVRTVAGVWPEKADAQIKVGGADGAYPGHIRAALQVADPLMMALGRPNREQVVTSRSGTATTLQAIELTNGAVLNGILRQGAASWAASPDPDPQHLVTDIYAKALGRPPSDTERQIGIQLVGTPATPDGIQDLLWTVTMLPDFQLIR